MRPDLSERAALRIACETDAGHVLTGKIVGRITDDTARVGDDRRSSPEVRYCRNSR
jgi:hypothetical protein